MLTDPHERAKYDSNRIRTNNIYRTGGNQRGNPWANVSSQFPTPPKPPTARARPPQPPRPLQELSDTRTLRRLVNLRINQLKKEQKLGEVPMKHGRG